MVFVLYATLQLTHGTQVMVPYLSEVKKHRKLSNKKFHARTLCYFSPTTRRTDYLRISAYSAQQALSDDVHLTIYVMTNQNGPCSVRVNQRADVQTQRFFGEVIVWSLVLVPAIEKDTFSGS